jgi:pilus assembly protein Flp/PilA
MFQLSVSPDFLSYLLAGLLAILFDWFPGLSAWFGQLSALKKRQLVAVLLLVVVLAIYAGVCGGLFNSTFSCDQAGFTALIQVYLLCVGINQGIHLLSKPGRAAEQSEPEWIGQGMVEYALILVLVAVVAIAALTIMGPLVANVFSTINASL